MKAKQLISTLITAGFLFFASVNNVSAQGLSNSLPVPETAKMLSAEGVNLELTAAADGRVLSVKITRCEDCTPTQFLPASDIEFRRVLTEITEEEAVKLSGGAGTVFYNEASRLARIVLFYGR